MRKVLEEYGSVLLVLLASLVSLIALSYMVGEMENRILYQIEGFI